MKSLTHFLQILRKFQFFRFLAVVLLVFLVSSFLFLLVESNGALKDCETVAEKFGLSIWWAVVTSSTVGYGDFYPQTPLGRTLAIFVMVLGITFFGVITASLTTFIVERRQREAKGLDTATISNHIVICGWNSYGQRIARELSNEGNEMVILAQLEESPLDDDRIIFVHGTPTSQTDQLKAGIDRARIAIFLSDMSNGRNYFEADANTILSVLNVESLCNRLGHEIYTCAELADEENLHHLKNAGVDEVVVHGYLNAGLLSQSARHPGFSRIINDLVSNDFGKEITRVAVRNYKEFRPGITVLELMMELKKKQGVILIALQEESGGLVINPPEDTVVKQDQLLYIIRDC